jgi:hypothetical protein
MNITTSPTLSYYKSFRLSTYYPESQTTFDEEIVNGFLFITKIHDIPRASIHYQKYHHPPAMSHTMLDPTRDTVLFSQNPRLCPTMNRVIL